MNWSINNKPATHNPPTGQGQCLQSLRGRQGLSLFVCANLYLDRNQRLDRRNRNLQLHHPYTHTHRRTASTASTGGCSRPTAASCPRQRTDASCRRRSRHVGSSVGCSRDRVWGYKSKPSPACGTDRCWIPDPRPLAYYNIPKKQKDAMRFPGKIVDVLEESHTVAFLQVR